MVAFQEEKRPPQELEPRFNVHGPGVREPHRQEGLFPDGWRRTVASSPHPLERQVQELMPAGDGAATRTRCRDSAAVVLDMRAGRAGTAVRCGALRVLGQGEAEAAELLDALLLVDHSSLSPQAIWAAACGTQVGVSEIGVSCSRRCAGRSSAADSYSPTGSAMTR